ncbi:MAG: PAS domain S-box protein [Actinomycetota bacterium]
MRELLPSVIQAETPGVAALGDAPEMPFDFRMLLEQLPCITYLCEADSTGALYMTPRCRSVLGYDPADFASDPELFLRLLHPEDEADVAAAWRHACATGEDFSFEYRLRARDGRYVWVHDQGRVVVAPDGRRYLQGVMVDISHSKQTERILEEERQRYRSLFANNPDGIFSLDLEGNFTDLNPACEGLCGYAREELLGTSFVPLVATDRLETAMRIHTAALEGNSEEYELVIVRKDGTRVEVWGKSMPIVIDGRIAGIYGVVKDITERTSAKAALQEAEERFRAIFEGAPVGVDLIDLDGRIVEANTALSAMLGYSREELKGKTVADITHPEDVHLSEEKLRGLPLEGDYRIQKRYMRKDGEIIWAEVTVSMIPAPDGSDRFAIGVIENVTERRRAELALQEAEERFRRALQSSPIGISLVDMQGKWLWVNPAMSDITGYTTERLLQMSYTDITPPEDVEVEAGLLRETLEGVRRGFEITQRYVHATGEIRWIQLNVTLMRDGQGAPVYFLFQVQDTTQRKRAEQALSEAEARFRRLVEQIPAVTYIASIGDSGQTEYVSPQVWRIAGISPDELLADRDARVRLIHPEDRDRVLEAIAEHRASGEPLRCEYRLMRPDGRTRWVLEEAVAVLDERGRPAVSQGLLFDITDRRDLEEQLIQSQKMEAVGRLAGGVAHDFNNLLAVIQNYAAFLVEEFEEDDPRREDLLEIRAAGERGANLVRQLLAFSRKEMVRPESVDINDVVVNMDKLLRRTIGEDVALVVDPDPELLPVRIDVGHLEQILANLAVNARDAMPDGGLLTISTENVAMDGGWLLQEAGEPLERYICLSVRDTGKGMPEHVASKVFEPFFTTKAKERGTGLGLAIVHGIVEQAGGHASVESVEGEGTIFRIYLPVDVQAAAAAPDDRPQAPAVVGRGHTVLVVEDEDGVRRIVNRILSRAGFEVVEAAPEEAVIRVTDERIDLVLTDVVMPGMSGREVAEAVREVAPDMPVLFMSGYTDEIIARHGVLEMDVAFLQKPFKAGELLEAAGALLRERV